MVDDLLVGGGAVVVFALAYLIVRLERSRTPSKRDLAKPKQSKPTWYPELDDDVDDPSRVDPPRPRRRGGGDASGVREPRRPRRPSGGARQERA